MLRELPLLSHHSCLAEGFDSSAVLLSETVNLTNESGEQLALAQPHEKPEAPHAAVQIDPDASLRSLNGFTDEQDPESREEANQEQAASGHADQAVTLGDECDVRADDGLDDGRGKECVFHISAHFDV